MQPISESQEHPAKRCAKCLVPMSEPDWVVNKDMAYCIDCASLLHLGESKESRMFSDMHDPVSKGGPGPVPGEIGDSGVDAGEIPALSDRVPEQPSDLDDLPAP